MGLFSSKKKHIVDTQVQRVVEDDGIPKPIQEVMISSILTDTNITDGLMDRSLDSPSNKFDRFYRYADKGIDRPVLDEDGSYTYDDDGNKIVNNEKYYYGLPDTILHTSSDGNELAEAQLEAEVGNAVDIDYLYFRPLNNVHAGLKHITETASFGYNPATNILAGKTTDNGFDTYLEKIVAVHQTEPGREPETTALGTMDSDSQTGESPLNALWDDPSSLSRLVVQSEVKVGKLLTESCEIHTVWKDDFNTTNRKIFVVDLTAYDQDREYYQAKYKDMADGTTHYWIYDTETGTNEELNKVFNAPDVMDSGTYYPIVMFRAEGENRAEESRHDTEEYKTTVELVDKLGMDFLETSEALHDPENDIDDIDQAVMMLAVPITSEDPTDTDYLYRWFEDLYAKLPNDAIAKYGSTAGFSTGPYGGYGGADTSWAITFSDADFEMKLSFESITFGIKAGNIGTEFDEDNELIPAKVGQTSNTTTLVSTTNHAIFGNVPGLWDTGPDRREIPAGVASGERRYIRRQISNDLYAEFVVNDMKARYVIYKNKGAEAGSGDDRCLIPLDRDIVREMSAFDQEILLYRSLHFVFNSHVVQKIKWYQRGAFKILLAIVAIVLIVINPAFGAAFAKGAAAFVTYLVTSVIIPMILGSLIVKFVLTAVARAIGAEAAMILAAVLAVIGLAKGFAQGSLVEGTASKLLKWASGLQKAVSNVIQEDITDIQDAWTEFMEMGEEKLDELKEIQRSLDAGIDINPFTFIAEEPIFVPGESTDEYFNRTVHNGNPGVLSLEIIENYHHVSLMLPTTEQTLEAA